MSYLVFDMETSADKSLINSVEFPGEGLSDDDAFVRFRESLREQSGGSDFVPVAYHVPVSIVIGTVDREAVLRSVDVLKANEQGEETVVRDFWRRIDGFDGTLVSFNGRGFDLPVLELQAMRYGIAAPKYFGDRNGFRSRWGRHLDLHDYLTNFGATRLKGGFDVITKRIGLPGKMGVSGADVQQYCDQGRFDEVHHYCRTDVIQTYFLLLRLERFRGNLTAKALAHAEESTAAFRAELTAG